MFYFLLYSSYKTYKVNDIKMFEILTNRGVIEISGVGSDKFLQNLITNDIFSSSQLIYTYLLSPTGRYNFDFFIIKEQEQKLYIDIAKENLQPLINKLNFYKLRLNIQIIDVSADFSVIYSKQVPDISAFHLYKDPRYVKLGWRGIIRNQLNLQDNIPIYLEDKYNYAIPDGITDLISDRSFIMEYGADMLNSVSYTKGCYIGQEVIARTKYTGVIRKNIFKVVSNAPINENLAGIKIYAGSNEIGRICSFYNNLAIALINEEKLILYNKEILVVDNQKIQIEIPEWRK